ncbi:MAG: hypothetical protein ACN2B6_01330 [Rickettsiales bacterium]
MRVTKYIIHWHYGFNNHLLDDCGYVKYREIFINPSAVSSQSKLSGCFIAGDVIYGQEEAGKTIFGKKIYSPKEHLDNLGPIDLYAIKMINGDEFIVDIALID